MSRSWRMDESIPVQRSRVIAMCCDNLILTHSSACRCGAESWTAPDGIGRLASVRAVSIVIVLWTTWTAWTAAPLFRKEDSIGQDTQSAATEGGSQIDTLPLVVTVALRDAAHAHRAWRQALVDLGRS